MRGRPESSDHQSAPPLGAIVVGAEGAGHADHATADTPSQAIPPAQPTPPTEQPKGLARFEQLKRQRDEMLARRRAEALAAQQNAHRNMPPTRAPLLLPSREKVAAKRTDEGAAGIFRQFRLP